MARRLRFGGLVVICGLLLGRTSDAAPELDPTFGTGGIVSTAVSTTGATPWDVVVQSDGKIIAAGDAEDSSHVLSSVLLRYLPDGSQDFGFGTAGKVTGPLARIEAVALQPDGKIVAGGYVTGVDFAVARYESDGTLDATFGVGGVFTTTAADLDIVTGIVLQPDGKIVAVGGSAAGGSWDTRLFRLLDDGTLDASFGTGGIAVHDLSVPDHDLPLDVALQPDGKIVTAGYVSGYVDIVAGVVRFDDTGNLDASFGTGGIAIGPPGAFWKLLVQDDGKIVAAGDPGLVRYDASGVLDPAFGTSGIAAFPGGRFSGLLRTADDKYHTTGIAFHDYSDDTLVVARYTADGVRDTSYGTSGVLEVDTWSGVARSDGVASALQPDGKVVVLANVAAVFQPYSPFTLLRFSSPVCGDGLVEPGEPCDDGNLSAGDGCDASCLIEPCRRCAGVPSTCSTGPRPFCTTSTRPDRSKLVLIDVSPENRRLKWKWKQGGAVSPAELGNPGDLDGERVCIFDGSDAVFARFDLPAGGTCKGRPCWQINSKRMAYDDPAMSSDGVRKLTLRLGPAGVPQISLKALGASMPALLLPASLPVTVELQRPTGQCWSATYTTATVSVNTGIVLRGVAAQ